MSEPTPLNWTTQQRTVSALKGCTYNPRRMSAAGKERLLTSLRKFNLVDIPVVNADDTILSGHQRVALLILEERGAELIDVRVPNRALTEEEAKEYMLQANNHAGEWDQGLLATYFTDTLKDTSMGTDDLVLKMPAFEEEKSTGRSVPAVLLASTEPDELPALAEQATTELGDVWLMGAHRILCADSTVRENVLKLMGGKKVDVVITDPPYAIYGSSTGIAADIADDKMVRPFFREVLARCAEVLKPFGHAYICCDWRSWASWWELLRGSGLTAKNMIVWDKDGGTGSMYTNCHELLLFASHRPLRRGMTQRIAGERVTGGRNVWRIPRAGTDETGEQRQHNAQKPVALYAKALEHSTDIGDIILDLFSGSGTAVIAAEQENRVAYVMEVEPRFCDLTVKRWQKFAGKQAIHEASGRTFDEVAASVTHATA